MVEKWEGVVAEEGDDEVIGRGDEIECVSEEEGEPVVCGEEGP